MALTTIHYPNIFKCAEERPCTEAEEKMLRSANNLLKGHITKRWRLVSKELAEEGFFVVEFPKNQIGLFSLAIVQMDIKDPILALTTDVPCRVRWTLWPDDDEYENVNFFDTMEAQEGIYFRFDQFDTIVNWALDNIRELKYWHKDVFPRNHRLFMHEHEHPQEFGKPLKLAWSYEALETFWHRSYCFWKEFDPKNHDGPGTLRLELEKEGTTSDVK